MTDHKKETVWITIPDEASPALEAPVQPKKIESADKVENKVFWGAGFIALIAFIGILFAPQQFAGLMQAQLFDGTFQVVPDYEQQDEGLFGESEDEEVASEEADSQPAEESVVEAESEAVSIQIEPLESSEEASAETESTAPDETVTPAEEAESIVVDGVETTEADLKPSADEQEPLDANAQLLQQLSQQLEEFKQKEAENEQKIQELTQLLQGQSTGFVTGNNQASSGFLGQGQQGQFGQTAQVGGAGSSVYRYNTHTVTVSPHDILAQNQGAQQAAYQANLTYQGTPAYSNQTYNPVLSTVQAQPGTGPAESMLFALLLASLGVLVWGSMRAIRA